MPAVRNKGVSDRTNWMLVKACDWYTVHTPTTVTHISSVAQ